MSCYLIMHELILIDGCQDSEPGKVLYGVLNHMAGIVGTIHADKTAGAVDMRGYAVARELVARSLNSDRNQVEAEALIGNIVDHPFIRSQDPRAKILVLIPEDLYAHNRGNPTNWVHGGKFVHKGREIVIMSAHRFYHHGLFDNIHFKYIMTHELGHVYGAASKGRSNTYELLGTHCSNDCVMQQDRTTDGGKARAYELHRRRRTFCDQCAHEMRSLHRLR